MDALENDWMDGTFADPEPPCLSLYQPTHRDYPANRQDPIRFRNLLGELEASLQRKFPRQQIDRLLQPFAELSANGEFWSHTLDGLAVLASPGLFRVYRLPAGARTSSSSMRNGFSASSIARSWSGTRSHRSCR